MFTAPKGKRYLYYRLSRLQKTHGTLSVAIRKSRHDKHWRSNSIVAFLLYCDVRLDNCVDFSLKIRHAHCMRHQNFYTVEHRLLLDKLHEIGIRDKAHRWIQSYLSQRTQVVKVDNVTSRSEVTLIYASVYRRVPLCTVGTLVFLQSGAQLRTPPTPLPPVCGRYPAVC